MHSLRLILTALIAPPLALVTALAALGAGVAWLGRNEPRWDILAHFAPLWLVVAAIGLVAGAFLQGFDRLLLCGLGLVGVIAAAGLILPEFLRDAGPKAAPGAPGAIKLVQVNVLHRNHDYARTVTWLEREDPDIAVLEETSPPLRAAITAAGRWHIACPTCEVMILSKQPPVATGAPKVATKADGPLSRATYRDAQGEFTVLGVHNVWPTEPEVQQPQERRLAETIAVFGRERTIVAGDFNSTPWSFSRRRWDKLFGLPRRDRALLSFPAPTVNRYQLLGVTPSLAIDHVYAGSAWATVSVKRGPRLGSDHYPVVVTLAPLAPK